jgi:hypothetical protein
MHPQPVHSSSTILNSASPSRSTLLIHSFPSATSAISIPSQPIPTSPTPRITHRQPIAPSTTHHTPSTSPSTIHPLRRKPLQPPRQIHASKVRYTNRRTGPSRQNTIQQRARIYVAAISRPTRWQGCAGIPANSKRQGQRVAYSDFRIARMGTDRVCSRRVNSPRTRTLRRRME